MPEERLGQPSGRCWWVVVCWVADWLALCSTSFVSVGWLITAGMIGNWTLENNLLRGLPERHAPSPASLSSEQTQTDTPSILHQPHNCHEVSTCQQMHSQHDIWPNIRLSLSTFCCCVIIHLKTVILPQTKEKEFTACFVLSITLETEEDWLMHLDHSSKYTSGLGLHLDCHR